MMEIISEVCSIARNIKKYQNKSVIQLLKESSYFDNSSSIATDDIKQYLVDHPDYINDWIIYSSGKRSSKGWYFLQERSDWIVGYLEETTNGFARIREEKFNSSFEACAAFIIKEINDLRMFYIKNSSNK
jgi:hypothetical protein